MEETLQRLHYSFMHFSMFKLLYRVKINVALYTVTGSSALSFL